MKPSFKGSKFEKTRQTLREIMIEADHAESSLRRLREGVRRALNDLESQKEASNLADIEAFVDACVQNNSRPARAAWLKHQFEGYKLDLAEQAEALAAGDAISIDGSSSDSSDDYDPRGKKPRLDERSKDSKLTGVKGKGKLNSDGIVKTRVITAAEVHMLVHIPELPQDVRVAYCKLRDQRIWTDWMEKFQSFLTGTTNEQVTWNRALRAWWASYGDCVWNRYFWVGTGKYSKHGWRVSSEANQVKSRLEAAKKSFVDLLLALERVAGPEVFHYLLFNIHPFWPDLGMPACMLKQLKSAEGVEYIETQGRKRWPDFAQFPNLLFKKDLLAITMDPSLPPKAQLQWSWSLLKWMREKAKIRKQEVEEMVKRVEAGFHLERTGPFQFVNYPEGVFEMPEWMRAQQSTEANFV
ncbi:hypothetical protein LEN26_005178, partial [Aphanomyces euteiches]